MGSGLPVAKGTLVLGRAKGRFRDAIETPTSPIASGNQAAMDISREGTAIDGDADVSFTSSKRSGYHAAGRLVGERGRTFAKSEEITASFHEGLPLEILKAMGMDNAWRETYIGGYDTATGYSWMASGRNTWIWKHNRNPPVPPTVHILASPGSHQPEVSPPYVTFVTLPSNPANEPALILVSPTGYVRFWTSIFHGLAGGDRFIEAKLPIYKRESISAAEGLLPTLTHPKNRYTQGLTNPEVVAGTSSGRLFRISVIRKGDGDWSISFKEIVVKPQRTSSILSNLFGFGSTPPVPLFNASSSNASKASPAAAIPADSGDGIMSLALGGLEDDGVDVWALSATNLAVWRLTDSLAHASTSSVPTVERLICKADMLTAVQDKLLEFYGMEETSEETGADVYSEAPDTDVNLAGSLPMQMERRERRILALGVELLDIILVRMKVNPVDPREPSDDGSRDDEEMQTDDRLGGEELVPVILVSFYAPSSAQGPSSISWRGPNTESGSNPRREERSYATMVCRFVGAQGISGTQPDSVKLQEPILRFEKPVVLPYSDVGRPKGMTVSGLGRGVNLGVEVTGAHGSKQGWFAPKMLAFHTGLEREADDQDDSHFVTQSKPMILLAVLFKGGMVFSALDYPFRDHLFLKNSNPFPRSVGFGIVSNSRSFPVNHPYSGSAHGSTGSFSRSHSRSQMRPIVEQPVILMGEIAYITSMGVVTVNLDFEKIVKVDEQSGGTNQIRSVMEQAVLYGPVPENPFSFRFSSNVNAGHLMMAASQISTEAIRSNPNLIKRQLSLTTQLVDRAARLEWLIQFINENGALYLLNATLRHTLATHAEQIAAAQGVWTWYDGTRYQGPSTAAGLGSRGVERSHNMLVQAVEMFQEVEDDRGTTWPHARTRSGLLLEGALHSPESTMEVADDPPEGEGYINNWRKLTTVEPDVAKEDVETSYVDQVRLFFKVRVEDIGELVPCAVKVVKSVVGSFERSNSWPTAAIQASRLALVLLESALQFRSSRIRLYGLDPEKPLAIPWTAETRILEATVFLFDQCGRTTDSSVVSEAKDVMQGLATVICEGYKEQVLAASQKQDGNGAVLQEAFTSVRRKLWSQLVQHRAEAHAFKLAEDFMDFRAITELCYQVASKDRRPVGSDGIGSIDKAALGRRLGYYLDRFKQDFAFELYHWWIEHGHAGEIFKETGKNADYVEAFFATYEYPGLSWLHLLGKQEFTAASTTLLTISQSEPRLGPSKFLLSLGKLCELVEFQDAETSQDIEEPIRMYDELLDLVDVQQKLRNDLLRTISDFDPTVDIPISEVGSKNVEVLSKAVAITERVTTRLSKWGRRESIELFKRLVGNLVGERRISLDDTLDLIGLGDVRPESIGHAVGLHLIYESRFLPDSRREAAIKTLWRRIYLCDDWESLRDTRSYSDTEVEDRLRSTALYSALHDIYTGGLATMLDTQSISDLIRRPNVALEIPTEEELSERFGGSGYFGEPGFVAYSAEDIRHIHAELVREQELLEVIVGILEDGGLWQEVADLETQDRQRDGVQEDTAMLSAGGNLSVPTVERGNSLGIEVD
ncbi:hypothetical protein PIIN_01203 [Serendipita indica DSM 11827]|uniref:Uncharacterized protein n=1 Tax=Serendipita indica (strain DSM 11827) TaxID=1109443 RepID=G4T7T4_SERID|nr:hypothetical protein PIIN_01203 [Serendipita indica DSM 11827]